MYIYVCTYIHNTALRRQVVSSKPREIKEIKFLGTKQPLKNHSVRPLAENQSFLEVRFFSIFDFNELSLYIVVHCVTHKDATHTLKWNSDCCWFFISQYRVKLVFILILSFREITTHPFFPPKIE